MTLLTIILVVLLILAAFLFILAGNRYQSLIKEYGEGIQFNFFSPVSLFILEKGRITERPVIITNLHHKIIQIYGVKDALNKTKLFSAQLISAFYLIFVLFLFFSIINKDPLLLYFGSFLSILAPLFLLRGLDKQIKQKQNQMLLELPEFLNKMVLLINAGETVQQAIIQSGLQKSNVKKSYFYKEVLLLTRQLQNNEVFVTALEDFNKRCGVQEISIFTTTVLLNYRRGGNELVVALRGLTKELWQKRKALVRTLGEQASSKLVFPMVLIFLVVLIIVGTPAMMLF